MLGQLATVSESSTSTLVRENTYDPLTANLTSTRSFGRPAQALAYYGDGTVWTATDGASHTTTYADYKRGVAQTVTLADQSVYGAVVNNYGEIDSVTKPGQHTTHYQYNSMGGLALIRPPTNDEQAWNETSLNFAFMGVPEPDIPFGVWKHTNTTGNAKTEVYFDALWRPVLTRTSDTADATATRRTIRRAFDSRGQEIAISYAGRAISYTDTVPGTRTRYDALSRVRRIDADKEGGGTASTTIDYLDSFRRQVTDARNNITTTSY